MNDGTGKEASQMENDEVGLLVVLARGAGAWKGRRTRWRGALLMLDIHGEQERDIEQAREMESD